MSEVKQYGLSGFGGGMVECEDGGWYHATDYAALSAENDRLRDLLAQKLVDSTMLTGLVPDASGINIGFAGGACGLLADAFGEQLAESNADNYIEATFFSRKHPEMGQIVVTVKRETGKTPHQLRQDAEQERDQLRARIAELERNSERLSLLANLLEDANVSGVDACNYVTEAGNTWPELWRIALDAALSAQGASANTKHQEVDRRQTWTNQTSGASSESPME